MKSKKKLNLPSVFRYLEREGWEEKDGVKYVTQI